MCPRCGLWPERWKQARLMDLFLSAFFSDHSEVGEWLDVVGQSFKRNLLKSDWGNAEHLFHSFCVISLWFSVVFFLYSSASLNSQCAIYWEQSRLRKEKLVICWSILEGKTGWKNENSYIIYSPSWVRAFFFLFCFFFILNSMGPKVLKRAKR